jgi:hypothetical protein
VPAVKPGGFTVTLTVPGVVPLIGAADNHVPPEADAVKAKFVGVAVTEIGWAVGVGDPVV